MHVVPYQPHRDCPVQRCTALTLSTQCPLMVNFSAGNSLTVKDEATPTTNLISEVSLFCTCTVLDTLSCQPASSTNTFDACVLLYLHTLTPSQALDGFLLVLDNEGTILYASDSITNIVGLTQVHTLTPPHPHSTLQCLCR